LIGKPEVNRLHLERNSTSQKAFEVMSIVKKIQGWKQNGTNHLERTERSPTSLLIALYCRRKDKEELPISEDVSALGFI
jgi:hypothetical protein